MTAWAEQHHGDRKSRYDWATRPDPCLLEHVSRLAREPWTDRPSCVHPVLGSIGRVVHDHSTRAGRAALLPLAPGFVGTARPGLESSARLVALCVSTALAGPGRDRVSDDELNRLDAAHRTALYLLGGQPAGDHPAGFARWWHPALDRFGLSEPVYRCFVATEQAAEAVVVTARAPDSDVRLRQLLRQCLATTNPSENVQAFARR